jgi:hypothetical protein
VINCVVSFFVQIEKEGFRRGKLEKFPFSQCNTHPWLQRKIVSRFDRHLTEL